LQIGDPARVAPDGNGCGAAMRVAPVGVITPSSNLAGLVRGAHECAAPTHGGPLAIGAAAAVAGAVSAALEGQPPAGVLAVAMEAAKRASSTMAWFIQNMYSDLAAMKPLDADKIALRYFPDKPANIVPLAIALALLTGSAEKTALLAANIGGDSDSVASIGGAVAGALHPETVNAKWFDVVTAINADNLLDVVTSLAALRPLQSERVSAQ